MEPQYTELVVKTGEQTKMLFGDSNRPENTGILTLARIYLPDLAVSAGNLTLLDVSCFWCANKTLTFTYYRKQVNILIFENLGN